MSRTVMHADGAPRPGIGSAPPRRSLSGPLLVLGSDDEAIAGALHFAELLARRDRVNAHVLGAARPVGFPVWVLARVDPEAMESGRRRQLLERLRQRVSGAVGLAGYFTVDAVTGVPARALAEAARARGSELVLAGCAPRGTPGRVACEDEILQLLRVTERPVLAVPSSPPSLPRRALVAMDFGASSLRAVRAVTPLLAAGATLALAHVAPAADLRALGQEGLAEIYDRGVVGLFEELAAVLAIPGDLAVQTVMLKGDPAPALLDLARTGGFDLIASGTHGFAGGERCLTGSVSTALLRGADCPVLIAPAAEAAR